MPVTTRLRDLLGEVRRTRVAYDLELHRRRPEAYQVNATRLAVLMALEDYASALGQQNLPVPPKMHRDLKMLRLLCAQTRAV
ncbi:MAG TPA: hypothetical protein VHW64_10205 [Nocardioides sp.]|jgi:hypothetical protein|uniref:hypothetical protein n=1 Tax=Nocardioides sp. TaxID=35761 RepID=UPI002E374C2A|nr:hypothetical protein [Nocardioides sp.]HEX3931069.1 hypothetical protein [Nocardioides sp.]